MGHAERRRHLRYRDPDSATVLFLIRDGASERPLTGLTINESYAGLACVYVGPALDLGHEILWRETADIMTPCRVMRCQELQKDVHLLALQIVG